MKWENLYQFLNKSLNCDKTRTGTWNPAQLETEENECLQKTVPENVKIENKQASITHYLHLKITESI